MAKVTTVEKKVVGKVVLELSFEEAQALFQLTGRVSGDPRDTPRQYTDQVYDVLRNVVIPDVGVTFTPFTTWERSLTHILSGSIQFVENPNGRS